MERKRLISLIPITDSETGVMDTSEISGNNRDVIECAKKYAADGIDEIYFLDRVFFGTERAKKLENFIKKISEHVFIPMTVGPAMHDISEMQAVLFGGADKVWFGSEIFETPEIIVPGSAKFGSQSIAVSVDIKRDKESWKLFSPEQQKVTEETDVFEFLKELEGRGAGEIIIHVFNEKENDYNFDLEFLAKAVDTVEIAIIAGKGIKTIEQVYDAFVVAGVHGVFIDEIMTNGEYGIQDMKQYLDSKGVVVRFS